MPYKEKLKRIEYCKQWRLKNKEKVREKRKQRYLKNKEKENEQSRQWYLNNKPKRNLYFRNKRKTDENYRIKDNLRRRINLALNGIIKSTSTLKLLGCSIEFLKKHLEKQFKPGMSWENKHLFHIDHIRPCASFDLSDPKQQAICFHYTNLQPLWAKENLSKGAKW